MITQEEYLKNIKDKLAKMDVAKVIYNPATAVHDMMIQRLFIRGIDGKGQKIGTYSTEPMYASKKQFKRTSSFRGAGKNDKGTKFANGNPRKSMYLPFGYKQLKQVQGYESDFVNLTYSGILRSDFSTKLAVDGESVVVRLSNQNNVKKVGWLTTKYGNETFKHTKDEREFFGKEVTKQITKYLNA